MRWWAFEVAPCGVPDIMSAIADTGTLAIACMVVEVQWDSLLFPWTVRKLMQCLGQAVCALAYSIC